MKVKTSELIRHALNYAVAVAEGKTKLYQIRRRGSRILDVGHPEYAAAYFRNHSQYSTHWEVGGPIIERENITTIRANDCYAVDAKGFTTSKRIPRWFAETSRWTGHSITTSYEGENMDPTFMIDETGGYYGPTPLIAAMRCFVASKLGDEVEIPEELL